MLSTLTLRIYESLTLVASEMILNSPPRSATRRSSIGLKGSNRASGSASSRTFIQYPRNISCHLLQFCIRNRDVSFTIHARLQKNVSFVHFLFSGRNIERNQNPPCSKNASTPWYRSSGVPTAVKNLTGTVVSAQSSTTMLLSLLTNGERFNGSG